MWLFFCEKLSEKRQLRLFIVLGMEDISESFQIIDDRTLQVVLFLGEALHHWMSISWRFEWLSAFIFRLKNSNHFFFEYLALKTVNKVNKISNYLHMTQRNVTDDLNLEQHQWLTLKFRFKILLEQQTISHTVKKFSKFYGSRIFIVVYIARPRNPTAKNTVQFTPSQPILWAILILCCELSVTPKYQFVSPGFLITKANVAIYAYCRAKKWLRP